MDSPEKCEAKKLYAGEGEEVPGQAEFEFRISKCAARGGVSYRGDSPPGKGMAPAFLKKKREGGRWEVIDGQSSGSRGERVKECDSKRVGERIYIDWESETEPEASTW
jgi:hypothetical protein